MNIYCDKAERLYKLLVRKGFNRKLWPEWVAYLFNSYYTKHGIYYGD